MPNAHCPVPTNSLHCLPIPRKDVIASCVGLQYLVFFCAFLKSLVLAFYANAQSSVRGKPFTRCGDSLLCPIAVSAVGLLVLQTSVLP